MSLVETRPVQKSSLYKVMDEVKLLIKLRRYLPLCLRRDSGHDLVVFEEGRPEGCWAVGEQWSDSPPK